MSWIPNSMAILLVITIYIYIYILLLLHDYYHEDKPWNMAPFFRVQKPKVIAIVVS